MSECREKEPLRIAERLSPNHGERRGGARPDMVVLHYTAMESARVAADRLCDPGTEVSAHYLIARDGEVLALVPERLRAWHAGRAAWGSVTDINSRSIGIELDNPGHANGYPPFPEPQMAALERLLSGILDRWAIPPERVVGHGCIAPLRKIDPGEKLDWRRLALNGLSVWLDGQPADNRAGNGSSSGHTPDATRFRAAARRFGYPVLGEGDRWTQALRTLWRNYTMRFRPYEAGCAPHDAGIEQLEALAARWPVLESDPPTH